MVVSLIVEPQRSCFDLAFGERAPELRDSCRRELRAADFQRLESSHAAERIDARVGYWRTIQAEVFQVPEAGEEGDTRVADLRLFHVQECQAGHSGNCLQALIGYGGVPYHQRS